MANENIPEQEYDDFNAPTPGESLTGEEKAWPWDNPPLYPSFEEAIDKTMEKLFEPANANKVATMLEAGISVEALARMTVFSGFSEGKFTPDVGMLMAKNVYQAILVIGEQAGLQDIRLDSAEKDSENIEFKNDMQRLSFVNKLSKKTEDDFKSLQTVKEEAPQSGLMARPKPAEEGEK
tara:strand:- start:1125 stop:1661 length:537 start_codon:yes stop_codon:yes gene_type:complete